MRTMLTATPINNGVVIPDCHTSTIVYDNLIHDATMGMVIRQAMDNARKLGFHAAAPGFFIRVEFKVLA